MYKIETIKINNVQSWKNATFNLSNFNIIRGRSNSGKSALIKSISMVFANEWDSSWLRQGENTCFVEIYFKGGNYIKRIRGSQNSVEIKNEKGSNKYTSFSTKYPQEVLDFLNNTDYNIGFQFDSHFFISESPNKRANTLSSFTDLSKVDNMLDKVKSLINENRSNKKFVTNEMENITDKINKKNNESFPNKDDVVNLIKELSLVEEMKKKLSFRQELSNVNSNIILLSRSLLLRKSFKRVSLNRDLVNLKKIMMKEEVYSEIISKLKVISKRKNFLKSTQELKVVNETLDFISLKIKELEKEKVGKICPTCNTEYRGAISNGTFNS